MATGARFLSLNDLEEMPTPAWAIEGLFEINSLTMLAGPPGSFKSFLALDWVLSMATHRDSQGRKTVPARVLYVLGEGKASLLKRIEAWTTYHGITPAERELLQTNFRVTFDVPQMASKASVDNLLAGLSAYNFTPNVIVVDTFARSFVGLDENSQKDTGMWIESADRLRQQGYTVIFLHHTAKNTEFGLKYRGSSAIMGAMDTAFTLCKDRDSHDLSELTCVKQKDHDEGKPMYLRRLIVRPNQSEEGSIVLVQGMKQDERFTEEYQAREGKIEEAIKTLLEDTTFPSDRARARELATRVGLTDGAAQSRIMRTKQRDAAASTADAG